MYNSVSTKYDSIKICFHHRNNYIKDQILFLNWATTAFYDLMKFYILLESLKTSHDHWKSKTSRAIMASSEEYKDFKKLLCWKERSVANPAGVGGGHRVWTHPPKLLGFTIYLHSKNVRTTTPTPSPPEKKFGLCQTNLNPSPKNYLDNPCSN